MKNLAPLFLLSLLFFSSIENINITNAATESTAVKAPVDAATESTAAKTPVVVTKDREKIEVGPGETVKKVIDLNAIKTILQQKDPSDGITDVLPSKVMFFIDYDGTIINLDSNPEALNSILDQLIVKLNGIEIPWCVLTSRPGDFLPNDDRFKTGKELIDGYQAVGYNAKHFTDTVFKIGEGYKVATQMYFLSEAFEKLGITKSKSFIDKIGSLPAFGSESYIKHLEMSFKEYPQLILKDHNVIFMGQDININMGLRTKVARNKAFGIKYVLDNLKPADRPTHVFFIDDDNFQISGVLDFFRSNPAYSSIKFYVIHIKK